MNMTFRALFYKYYITEYENFSLKKGIYRTTYNCLELEHFQHRVGMIKNISMKYEDTW